jgi:hypothetical protein
MGDLGEEARPLIIARTRGRPMCPILLPFSEGNAQGRLEHASEGEPHVRLLP